MLGRRLPLAVVLVGAVGALGGCNDDGGDLGAFCATAQRFAADNPAAVFERFDPADPAGAAPLLRDAAERLEAWAAEAPGEIDDDVTALADAAAALAAQFELLADAEPAVGETSAYYRIETAEVEAASTRVLEFTRTECQVDLDA